MYSVSLDENEWNQVITVLASAMVNGHPVFSKIPAQLMMQKAQAAHQAPGPIAGVERISAEGVNGAASPFPPRPE